MRAAYGSMSSLLTRFMHTISALPCRSLDRAGPAPLVMLGLFVQVYCDATLLYSTAREEHLVHVYMVFAY